MDVGPISALDVDKACPREGMGSVVDGLDLGGPQGCAGLRQSIFNQMGVEINHELGGRLIRHF